MDLDEDHQPAAAAAEAVVKQEYDEDTDDDNMDVDLSYIDRLVHDVENNGEEDDSSMDIVSDNDGQDDEAGNPSGNDNEGDSKEGNSAKETEDENGGEEGKENEALSDDEFEYDSDEESAVEILGKGFKPPSTASRENISEESKAHLYWGVDNACTRFSDWSIEVTATQEGGLDATKTYYVHKSSLALGPKKSGYFETLFTSEHFNESSSNTSRLTLTEDVASSFPDFLDYLYCPSHEARCVITKGNWRALRYLADYFIIPKLTEEITYFVQKDMRNLQHCEEYLSAIDGIEEKESKFIIALATKACTEMILSIEVGSSLHTMMPPAMFLRAIETIRTSHDMKSLSSLGQYHICRLVVVYLQTHQDILDEQYFDAITWYLYFPDDVKQAGTLAIDLLQIIEETTWTRGKYGIECVCTAALSQYLADGSGPDLGKISDLVSKIPKAVCGTLLAEAVGAKRKLSVKTFGVSCKLMNDRYGMPMGRIIKISIKSTDSVNRIRYLVGRELNGMPQRGRLGEIIVFCRGTLLQGEQIVSRASVTPNTVLEIR